MLLSEAETALFGAKDASDISIKFFSRMLPLLQAPLRILAAFAIRQALSAGKHYGRVVARIARRRGENNTGGRLERVKLCLRASVSRSAFQGSYVAVPRAVAGLQFVAVWAVCLFVFTRLALWRTCDHPEIRRSCAVPAYQVFKFYDGDHDPGSRSSHGRACACNTLFYSGANCTEPTSSTLATRSRGSESPVASIFQRPAILRPAVTIFMRVCPSDSAILEVLGSRAQQPALLRINIARHKKSASAAAHPWTFPSNFGYHRSPTGTTDDAQVWPLRIFEVIHDTGDYGPTRAMTHQQVKIVDLPPSVDQMVQLRSLRVHNVGLTRLPQRIGRLEDLVQLTVPSNDLSSLPSMSSLSNLRVIKLNHNHITSIAADFQQMTDLRALECNSNSIASIPAFLGQLASLEHLRLEDNEITEIPAAVFEQLPEKKLRTLRLAHNSIRSIPSSLGRLTGLQQLRLSHNLIPAIPSSLSRLTDLNQLTLANNSMTTIPTSIVTASRSSGSSRLLVDLDTNNISVAAVTEIRAAMSSTPSPASSSSASPNATSAPSYRYLMVLGRNPACANGSLALSSQVGLWLIQCEPSCAVGCVHTPREYFYDGQPLLGDGRCNGDCDTAACQWDAGDCEP